MISLQMMSDFFLAEWLWSMTWGMYQAPIAALYMIVSLCIFTKLRFLQTLLLSLLANVFSYGLYSALVIGVLVRAVNHEYLPAQPAPQHTSTLLFVAIYLAIIYTVLQAFLYLLIKRWNPVPLRDMMLITLASNVLAAWSVYLMLPLYI